MRELLAAAASLKYATIEEACDEFLRRRLTRSNCLRMLNLAFTYSLAELTDEALQMASLNFMELSDGFDFYQMDVDQLVALLDGDGVMVTTTFLNTSKHFAHTDHTQNVSCLYFLSVQYLPSSLCAHKTGQVCLAYFTDVESTHYSLLLTLEFIFKV